MTNELGPRVIVALDYANPADAITLARRLDPKQCRLKVGKELFTRGGPQVVEQLHTLGFEIFLDLKFHDIPNTVAGACTAAAELGVWMVNVHTLGGRRMMEAARESIDAKGSQTKLIGVTILTSMGEEDIREIGLSGLPAENVRTLAILAKDSGLDGVVCSPKEVELVRANCGDAFMLVTPGIRPIGADVQDQKRITTPEQALTLGSTYLVIGRPITAAGDPCAALAAINSDIARLV